LSAGRTWADLNITAAHWSGRNRAKYQRDYQNHLDGGSNGTTVPAGTTKSSDAIVYTLDNTVAQIVTVYTTSRSIEYHQANGETLWSNFSAPDQSQNATVTGYSSGGLNVIASIVATNITAFTYRNTLGVTPVASGKNDALLKLAVNPLAWIRRPAPGTTMGPISTSMRRMARISPAMERRIPT